MQASGKYHVLLGSRDQSKGQKAVEAISAKAENIEALQIDVADDASIDRAAKTVKEKFGRLDIVSCLTPSFALASLHNSCIRID